MSRYNLQFGPGFDESSLEDIGSVLTVLGGEVMALDQDPGVTGFGQVYELSGRYNSVAAKLRVLARRIEAISDAKQSKIADATLRAMQDVQVQDSPLPLGSRFAMLHQLDPFSEEPSFSPAAANHAAAVAALLGENRSSSSSGRQQQKPQQKPQQRNKPRLPHAGRRSRTPVLAGSATR